MRVLVVLVLVVGGALAAAWLGGETWLAREAARRIAADPRIAAAAVTPLREIDRIGLRMADLTVETADGAATLPALDLWAAPTAPTAFHASLPPRMSLPLLGARREVTAADAVLSLRLSPGSGMAVSRAAVEGGAVAVDGAPLLAGIDFQAVLAPMGAAAPADARASYDVGGTLRELTPAALVPALPAALAEAGPISAEGRAKLYLTGPLRQGAADAAPRLEGMASDGLTLRLGDRTLRLAGTLRADADRRPEGAVFAYTDDARGWVDLAAALGAIPQALAPLVGTTLEQAAATEVALPAGVTAPPAARGELRVPLIFRDGKVFLGPLALGEAPRFPG